MSAVAPVRFAPGRSRPGRSPAAAVVAPASRPQPTASRPQPTASRPQLSVVAPARLAAGPLPFALLISGVLGAGLVVLLMLHTLAAQDAFTVHKLQRQSATLGDVEQQLAVANEQAQAPSTLAARARALGMVPTGSLQIVRHRDGRVVAVATAIAVPPAPSPSPAGSPANAAGTTAGATNPSASPTPRPTTSANTTKPAQDQQQHPTRPRHPH